MKRLLILLALLAVASAPCPLKPRTSPTSFFIFSDDHAQHAVSAYGSKVNQTPHIDRLAKDGARFTRSFELEAMGSNIEHLTFCLETTAECRQIRTFLRPAPEATNPLRGRRILQP